MTCVCPKTEVNSLEARYDAFCATHPPRTEICGGHSWCFRQGGDAHAPAVLLLPGALGRPETSFEYITALEPHLRVIAPGYPVTAKTMSALADGAADLLQACGVDAAHVVGGSFGGLAAQALLERHPHRVKRLVLSDTSPPVPARALRMQVAQTLIGALPERLVRAVFRFGINRYVTALPVDARHFWRNHFEEMLRELTKKEIENRAHAWGEFDKTPFRFAVCRETLILCAQSDHLVSPDKILSRFPHASVHVVSSPLGHAASVGDAPAYLAPILRFLTETEGGA